VTNGRNADTGAAVHDSSIDPGKGYAMDKYMTVRGPLTATTVVIGCDRVARHMRDDILGAVAGEPRDLVIDLRQVGQLSSTGLAALVGVRARQRARMKTLTLVCGESSGTQLALAQSGMTDKFNTVTEMPPPW
jgi:anti-anti-sigma regulatory factor